jgi:hypothetical protein
MTDYTNHIRKAATWIDRHPDLPVPVLRSNPNVQLAWHVNQKPIKDQMVVLDAVRNALGNVPWQVQQSGNLMWVTADSDGLNFTVFVSAASLEGFTSLELETRMAPR